MQVEDEHRVDWLLMFVHERERTARGKGEPLGDKVRPNIRCNKAGQFHLLILLVRTFVRGFPLAHVLRVFVAIQNIGIVERHPAGPNSQHASGGRCGEGSAVPTELCRSSTETPPRFGATNPQQKRDHAQHDRHAGPVERR